MRVEFTDPATGQSRVDTFLVQYRGWLEGDLRAVEQRCEARAVSWIERRFFLLHPLTGEQSINSKYSKTVVSSDGGAGAPLRSPGPAAAGDGSCAVQHRTLEEHLAVAGERLAEVFEEVVAEDGVRLAEQLRDDFGVAAVELEP